MIQQLTKRSRIQERFTWSRRWAKMEYFWKGDECMKRVECKLRHQGHDKTPLKKTSAKGSWEFQIVIRHILGSEDTHELKARDPPK